MTQKNMYEMLSIVAKYYKEKSEEFAKSYGIPYTPFEQNIKKNCGGNVAKYIEDLLNGIIDEVAKKSNRSFDDVKTEYISKYI